MKNGVRLIEEFAGAEMAKARIYEDLPAHDRIYRRFQARAGKIVTMITFSCSSSSNLNYSLQHFISMSGQANGFKRVQYYCRYWFKCCCRTVQVQPPAPLTGDAHHR
jgi:hypothetical protein